MITAVLAGWVFGVILTLGILAINRFPLLAWDTLRLFAGCLIAAGIPIALAVLALTAVLGRWRWARRLGGPGWAPAWLLTLTVLSLIVIVLIAGLAHANLILRHVPLMLLLSALQWRYIVRDTRVMPRLVLGGIATLLTIAVVLPTGVPLRTPSRPQPDPPPAQPAVHDGRIVVLGIDGLCWETLQRWQRAGGSPDYEDLRDECVVMPITSMIPTRSPQIWTTAATGCQPRDHQALRFTTNRVLGLDRPIQRFPRFSGAVVWLRLARRLGVVTTLPISSLDVRCPPFWELLSGSDRDIDVVGWWCSWPALELNGRLVSDRFFFWRDTARFSAAASLRNVTYPPELEVDLSELRVPPHEMPIDTLLHFMHVPRDEAETILTDPNRVYRYRDIRSELPMAWAMDETYCAVGEEFLRSAGPNTISAIYLRGADIVSHPAMQFSHLYPETSVSDADRDRYGDLISRYYTYVFRIARRLIDAAGDDAVIFLISDHGFERIREDVYGHNAAPPGVMMARLPRQYAPEPPSQASIYDITPTLLWLCGYPPAEDMPGHPLTSLFRPRDGGAAPTPLPRISSYGRRMPELPPGLDLAAAGDEEMIELLRNLGYIR